MANRGPNSISLPGDAIADSANRVSLPGEAIADSANRVVSDGVNRLLFWGRKGREVDGNRLAPMANRGEGNRHAWGPKYWGRQRREVDGNRLVPSANRGMEPLDGARKKRAYVCTANGKHCWATLDKFRGR